MELVSVTDKLRLPLGPFFLTSSHLRRLGPQLADLCRMLGGLPLMGRLQLGKLLGRASQRRLLRRQLLPGALVLATRLIPAACRLGVLLVEVVA